MVLYSVPGLNPQPRAWPMQQRGSTMTDRLRVDQDAEADQDSVVDVDMGGEGGIGVQVEQREHIGQRSMVDGDGEHTVRLGQGSTADDLSSVNVEVANRLIAVDLRIRTSQRDEADQRADVDVDDDGASAGGTGVGASIEHHLDIDQRTDVFVDLEDDDGVLRLEVEIEIDTDVEEEADVEIDIEDDVEDDVEAEIDQNTRVTDESDVRIDGDDLDGAFIRVTIDKLVASDMEDSLEVDLSDDGAWIDALSKADTDIGVHVDVFIVV